MTTITIRAAICKLEKMLAAARHHGHKDEENALQIAIEALKHRMDREAQDKKKADMDREIDQALERLFGS